MDSFQQKAHFLRRATGGATIDELNSNTSAQQLLSQWLNTPPVNVIQLAGLPDGQPDPKLLDEGRQQLFGWLLNQMVTASNPLHERIVSFWRDHFVISARKTNNPYMLQDYETRLRTYAFGDFQELLFQVTTSPGMLQYLDGRANRSGKINENFSRELKELFTIGVGNYTETDVQEGARALTGWTIQTNLEMGKSMSLFNLNQHDTGRKTYLGQTGNFKTEDIVEILANNPNTARTIVRKLWSTFVYPNPEPAIVERLAKVYQDSKRNLKTVIEAVFTSPEFYSSQAYLSQIRSPQEFVVASSRQLQLIADPARSGNALRSMGQMIYNPPSVKGWPNDQGWLTAPSLLTRINLARQITVPNGDSSSFYSNPNKFTKETLVTLLLDGTSDPQIQAAKSTLSVPEFASLLLSSPLYQLA